MTLSVLVALVTYSAAELGCLTVGIGNETHSCGILQTLKATITHFNILGEKALS